jgi:formylglycine-generating enzyme required for sulfatase activity
VLSVIALVVMFGGPDGTAPAAQGRTRINPYGTASAVDPTGAANGRERAERGGSWFSGPLGIRASVREFHVPQYRYTDVGVRCAGD